jgi:hypothetical protein
VTLHGPFLHESSEDIWRNFLSTSADRESQDVLDIVFGKSEALGSVQRVHNFGYVP